MCFGKKGRIWMWVLLAVVLVLVGLGLYFLISKMMDADRITDVGRATLSLILAR